MNANNTTSQSYWEKLKATAQSGLATGVGIAAIAAPIIVVFALSSWISKKD
jgi:hypothetical protein